MLTFTPGATSATATSCYMGSVQRKCRGRTVWKPGGLLESYDNPWPPNDFSGILNGVGKKHTN